MIIASGCFDAEKGSYSQVIRKSLLGVGTRGVPLPFLWLP